MAERLNMKALDIFPFSLPNCGPGEVRFEETRDIREVVVTFDGPAPAGLKLSYLRKIWPEKRLEFVPETMENPFYFGWVPQEDWFNCAPQRAAIKVTRLAPGKVSITFQGLAREFPEEAKHYDVTFRRTFGFKVESAKPSATGRIRKIEVYTASAPVRRTLRVRLDAGKRTVGSWIRLTAYNAVVRAVKAIEGDKINYKKIGYDYELTLKQASKRSMKAGPEDTHVRTRAVPGGAREFWVTLDLMAPAHPYCGDAGLLTFELDHETFTIRPDDLATQGPIWFAEEGFFITQAEDAASFEDYRKEEIRYRLTWDHKHYYLRGEEAIERKETIAQRVATQREQSFSGAFYGQPRPHSVNYSLGCKHARQRFWLEANGDLVLHKRHNLEIVKGKDTARFLNKGDARFFFGLEKWAATGRFNDPAPVMAYNIHLKRGAMLLEQKSFAVPLMRGILDGEMASDETVVALVRFRFRNTGDKESVAELPIGYSQESIRSTGGYWRSELHSDDRVPLGEREELTASGGRITSRYEGKPVLRGTYESTMKPRKRGGGVVLEQRLAPGETCEAVLKIPYIAIDRKEETAALGGLDFERCHREVTRFWREENRRGSQIRTPVDHLNALYAAHLSHVQITDMKMPDEPELINTSVGSSTYPNFCNESCMILQELDQRGLHEDVRRRLAVWVKYQGTAKQPGNFTDFDGMFFGAGGFESGWYNQHHGWVLWYLTEHYLLTQDREWFGTVEDSVLAGADWIFRQRRNTMSGMQHSRGWEHGFLPAGSLEDVTDYFYWLSTNALTWRGADSAARALELAGHPEAGRVRREADAYREDLRWGFETMRQHAPLVRLRDGRWVPHYPSRLYVRGRDAGWIRETLEGSIYLLLSGLYDAGSKEAQWILDDYQDNRYMKPPYGYHILDVEENYFHRGGFSMQPTLLAGLLPYLDRDEPEIYIWMFFNTWAACYREEINAMSEHPWPVLGYSNFAHFKTSDEANAVMWLRYMFVYAKDDALYLGRAIPRAWLESGEEIGIKRVATCFGEVSLRYEPDVAAGKIRLTVELKRDGKREAKQILARIRHPEAKPIRSVKVNGKKWAVMDPAKGDVDVSGISGRLVIEARY